jgi:type IVB pilus formation R64 PilN family outer membrane protein
VTVTDTPASLDQIARLVEGQNALLSKQVLIDIKVVTLKMKNREQFGIDWSLVYKKVGGNTLGLANTAALKDAAGAPAFIFGSENRGLDGSQSVINALADQADIGDVTSAKQFALNNQPTPIQVGTTSRFVDSITRSYDTTTGRETYSVATGAVTSGVALQLLPRILDNQNLLIHLSADLSENPDKLDPVAIDSRGDNKISLWTQNVRNFMQRVSLRSGETLVISGYENNYNEVGKQGAFTPDNLVMGGSRSGTSQRNIIVIMITPVIMDRIRS